MQFNSCLLSAPGEQPSPAVPFSGREQLLIPIPCLPSATHPHRGSGAGADSCAMHAQEEQEILTSPRPGALTVPGNPCWDGLSLWRAPSCPGEQGDRLSTPELFHTPAQAAAHAPQEDPHSSPAPHNSSPQSPHVHRDTGVPGTCSNFSCQGAAALCSAPRAALLRGGG